MSPVTAAEWYARVPEVEHASGHRYCDPALCPALIRRSGHSITDRSTRGGTGIAGHVRAFHPHLELPAESLEWLEELHRQDHA